jgi:excisionase family DNA binding protein
MPALVQLDAAIEPLALSPMNAARSLSLSKRTLSRLIARRKIEARKDGVRTLVDVASLKSYHANLPKKTDHAPPVFGRRAHMLPRSCKARRG